MATKYLSDGEVFGSSGYLSEDEVFGASGDAAPPGAQSTGIRQDLPAGIAPSTAGGGRGSINPPMAAERQPVRTQAKQPTPYRDRREALDDAVNLLEEGADQKAVTETFSKGGIKFDEIVEHGRKRGSEYFKQQSAPTVYPEVTRPANRYPTPVTGEIKSTRPDTPLPGADVLLAGAKGVVGGFKMLMSAGGAGGKPTSAAEKAIKTADLYLEGLRSAAAIKDDDRIGQIMEEAKDGTWADQVAAAAKAAGVAPASLVAQGLGTSVPVILATLLPGVRESTVARLTAQIGLGAAQGAGATKESIYNAVKDDMLRAGVPKFEAEERAEAAQSYLGQNKDQIAVGMALGALASSTGVEKVIPVGQVSKVMAKSGVSRAVASAEQNVIGRGLIGGLTEAVPEFAQGSADQVAQNVALQREGRDVPTFQGAVGQGALEAIAGFGAGAVTNAAFGRPQTAADQLARELDVSIANTDLTSADPTLISTSQTLRQPNDAGPSAPSRNVSFTPADSPTAQAGLVPIVVGIPSATPAETQSGAIQPINPNAGQESGLDELQTGSPNVSTPGMAGTEIAAGSIAGSDQQRGGVGPARSDLTGAGGLDVPGAAVNARDDGQAVASGGAGRQLAASLTRPKLAERATDKDLLARTESAIAAAESGNAAPQPVEQWVGRKGDGYLTEADAAQALPGRQRMFPALAWGIEQMPGGKFRLAGYEQQSSQLAPIVGTTEERAGASLPTQAAITTPSGKPFSTEKTAAVYAQQNGITDYSTVKIDGGWAINPTETTLGNQTTQAIKGQTQGQQAPAIGGAAGSGLFQAMDRGSAAQAQGGEDVGVSAMAAGPDTQPGRPGALSTPEGARDAGINAPLRLAPPAPIRAVGNAITALKRDAGVSAKADTSPMTDRQQAASAVARMLGRTVTYLKADTPASIPNGFMVAGDSKNIFIASDSEDAPLSVAMHEIYHTLPELQRKALNKQLTQYFRQDRREEFANRFDYDPKNDSLLDEEISAFMVQAISKREDFWQDLRTKMGNKEFSEVAKTILAKLNAIIGGANTAYGDGFVSRYISDVVKARDLLTDAYAQAMRDQGVAPDVAAANAAAAPLADQADAEMGAPDMGQQGNAPSDYVDRLTQDIDMAGQALSAIKGINLFSNLGKLKLTAEDWREIGTLPAFSRGGASARKLVDRVADGLFDEYLPFDMRHDSARFDEKESTEYIKDALRSWQKGAAYYPFAVRMEMAQLEGQIAELTAELNQEIQLDDINKEIASIADELAREAASNVTQQEDTNGDLAEAQGSSPQEGLTSYSPKEIEALEKARAKREADQSKADAEADQRAQADAERDTFTLTGSDRAADVGAAMGQDSMFSKRSGKDTTKAEAIPAGEELIAIHNLTTENLLYADEIGGLPVPSIGVTKAASPFYAFGNITLLAPKGMVDPATGTPVFDRDAYTSRFPGLNYKKAPSKKADAFYAEMKPVVSMGDDGKTFLSYLWEGMTGSSASPSKVLDLFDRYNAPKIMYAKEVLGKTIKVPMRDLALSSPASSDKEVIKFLRDNEGALKERDGFTNEQYETALAGLKDVVFAAIDRYVDKKYEDAGRRGTMAERYKESVLDSDGNLSARSYQVLMQDMNNVGKKRVDVVKLSEQVRKLVPSNDPAYLAWAKSKTSGLFGQPTITVRGKQVAPTLENIVDAMTAGGVAGAEKTMTSGVGKVSAMLGKRFKSLDEIKAARSQVVSTEQEGAGKKDTEKLLDDYREKALEFFTETDWSGKIDTWAGLDAAMEALAVAGKGALTDGNVRVAMQRKGFRGVDQETIDLAKQGVEALRSAVTDYFEAKPQRAVALSEFRGAVVPKGMDAKALEVLAKNNIETVEFNPKKEGDREAKLQKLAKKLDKADGDIMFSRRAIIDKLAYQGYEKAEVPRVQAARNMAGILAKLDAGKITPQEFELQVRLLAERMADTSSTKRANKAVSDRQRGADIVREKLIAARRRGEVEFDTAEFALWALQQNPALAVGLGISVRDQPEGKSGVSGDYNPATSIMRVFKGSAKPSTAVHEILHHTERMMPEDVQKGVRKEWANAYAKALKKASPSQRVALENVINAIAGDINAQSAVRDAFADGTLDADVHYQLVNPSEFWAVNATDILQRRYEAGSWIGRAKQWLSEMLQKAKGLVGMRSNAPVLRGLEAVLNGNGERLSNKMLLEGNLFEDIAAPGPDGFKRDDAGLARSDNGAAPPHKAAKYMAAVDGGDMVDVTITEDRDEDTLYAVTATSPSSDKAFVTAEAGTDGSFQIQESGVPQMDQGKGLGVRLYEGLIRNLFDRGTITVTSDSSVSADAQRVYKALERRGYAVTQNQSAKIDEETGAMESPGVEPVFTVQDKKLDKADGDIRFSNRRQKLSTIGQNFTLPATSRFDAGRIKLQDDALRMKRVIEAVKNQGGTVGEAQNFYDAITLMPGRVQGAMEDFRDKAIRPLINKAVKFGIDLGELALYAYAKHAEERNDYISSINNRFPDGGSGMTNADADVLIAKAKDEGKAAKFEELHRDLMAITATTRQVMLTEGLINQDEFDALDSAYENYIPLRGLENVDESTGAIRPGVGRGINVRGGETIRAMGRRSRASDLIENVIRDYERVITRVDRNDTGKVLLDFVLSNPDPDLWGVDVERSKPSLNKVTGLVQYTKSIEKGEDTIGVKVGGEQVYIKFADKDLTRALRQAWRDETSGLERATLAMTGWWNNWMRNVLTRYNPAFAALNIPRDALWSGTTAALAELGPKGLTRYLANYGKALMASIRQEAGVTGTDNKIIGNRQMDRAFQEFRSAGSITGGFYMRSLDDINKDLRNEMLLAGAKSKTTFEAIKSLPPYKLATLTARMLEFMGSASENATRFALYQAARDVGKTPAQAALLAKDGTTNFNRKGEWGGALNNLYLFFNAAVQGNAQLAKVLKSPAVQASMAGVTGVGFMLAMLGASAGGEDDDGEAYWDKIPSHVKERNLVFMLPPGDALADSIERAGKRGRYFTVPVQYGFNIFPNIGYMMADVMRNAQDTRRGVTPTKAALHMTSTVFGSINPLGGAIDFSDGVQVLLAAMPTLADLPIQLVNERGTFGAPSAPQKSPWDNRPDSERMFTSQEGTVPAKIAKMLNEMGSGNEGKGGTMLGMDTSVTPGTIQTLISATTGGLGSFAEQVGSSVIAMTNDNKDLKAAKIPFLNKFYGEVDESANIRIASDRARKIGQLSSEVKAQQEFGIEAALTKEEQKLVDMANDQERFQKELSGLRKEEMEIIADEKLTPAEKTLRRRMIQVERDKAASEFNKEFFKSAK